MHRPAVVYTAAAMPVEPADEDLMLRYSSGDAAAFDVLYARHRAGVFRYLLRQCGSRAAAEELVQDIWLNLMQARDLYQVQAKFTTWLYTLAHNRLIDHFRRHKGPQRSRSTRRTKAIRCSCLRTARCNPN